MEILLAYFTLVMHHNLYFFLYGNAARLAQIRLITLNLAVKSVLILIDHTHYLHYSFWSNSKLIFCEQMLTIVESFLLPASKNLMTLC